MPYLSTDPDAGEEVPGGLLTPGNIDLGNRPRVKNSDGSISTVRSIGVDFDGKEYLIPTVTEDGRVVSNDEAVNLFKRTGKHLGIFDSPAASTAYAKKLHESQAKSLYLSTDPNAGEDVAEPKAAEQPPRETMNYRGLRMARQGGAVEVSPDPTEKEKSALYDQAATVGTGAAMFGGGMLAAGPGVLGSVARVALSPYTAGAYAGAKTLYNTGDPIEAAQAAVVTGIAQKGAGEVLGKLIKFVPKSIVDKFAGMFETEAAAAKDAVTNAVKGGAIENMGTIAQDDVLSKVAAGDVEGAATALAKGLGKSPKAAEAFAKAMEEKANAVAPAGAPTFSPTDSSPAAVAARNAARRARLGTAPAPETIAPPGPPPAPTAPARQMPVPGNVKPATVYTKPGPKVKPPAGESEAAKALAKKQGEVASPDAIRAAFGESPKGSPHARKGPSGAPLTAAERREALIKLQESIASGQDIFAAFGLEN